MNRQCNYIHLWWRGWAGSGYWQLINKSLKDKVVHMTECTKNNDRLTSWDSQHRVKQKWNQSREKENSLAVTRFSASHLNVNLRLVAGREMKCLVHTRAKPQRGPYCPFPHGIMVVCLIGLQLLRHSAHMIATYRVDNEDRDWGVSVRHRRCNAPSHWSDRTTWGFVPYGFQELHY